MSRSGLSLNAFSSFFLSFRKVLVTIHKSMKWFLALATLPKKKMFSSLLSFPFFFLIGLNYMSCFKSLTSISSLNPHNPKRSLTICCCCSGAKSCPTLCDPMNCSTPGFPVLHYLPEFAQTHVHLVGDAIQPSHPLSPLSPPALNLFQH